MKRLCFQSLLLVTLFLAGVFIVPSSATANVARLQSSTLNSTGTQTTYGNQLAELPNDRVFRVALYHETNTTRPTYVPTGGLNSNYSAIYSVLINAGFEVHNVTFQDILNHELTTANYDVLVLADNCPRENITNLVKEFWLAGGGILGLDSAISYLGYYGILYRESEGVNDGRGAYWNYNYNDNATIVNRHPVTLSYANGTELRFLYANWAQIDLTAFATTSVWPDTTVLAVDSQDPNWGVAVAVDPVDKGGRVVQIGMPVAEWPSGWNPMIVDAINWLAPRPRARIAYDFSHQPRLGVDMWDNYATILNSISSFSTLRDALVSRRFTFDKFYPSALGNFTAERLANYDMIIVDYPDLNFTTSEVSALQSWVNAGGGLLVLGDRALIGGDGNQYINFLLGNFGMSMGVDNTMTVVGATVSTPIHPTTEDCTLLSVSYRNNITLTGADAIWQYNGNVLVAGQDYGNGRAILAADQNIFDNGQIVSFGYDNMQFAVNVANWLTSSQAKVLLYTDDPYGPGYYRNMATSALNQLGIDYYLIDSEVGLNASLNGTWFGSQWDLVIIDHCTWDRSPSFPFILQYLRSGRQMILTAWNLYAHPSSPILSYIGVNSTGQLTGDHPSYIWDSNSPVFDGIVHYGAPTLNIPSFFFTTNGATFSLYDNATAIAGATPTEQAGNASIVLSNSDQVLFNGFMLNNLRGDADNSTYMDGFELYMNEIAFMMSLPTIDSPADIQYEAGSTGHSISWHPSDSAPASYQILIDGSQSESGSWTGGAITANIDGLGLGVHSVECRVVGHSGEPRGDIVRVTVVDTSAPLLNSPPDITMRVGSTGNKLTWIASDPDPSHYVITMNTTLWTSGVWNGSSIVLSLDGLGLGTYFFTVRVNDTVGHQSEDTVLVTVVEAGLFGLDPTTLILIGVAVLALVIIGVVGYRRRSLGAAKPKPKPRAKKQK